MTDKQVNFEIKEINFFLSSPHEHVMDARVFGLGKSFFMPSTETVQIQSYLLNPIKLLLSNSFGYMPFEPTFCHEMGHYQLTLCSRLGNAIREISVVLDGLSLLIIKRMTEKHKKIWIPFLEYNNFYGKDKRIEMLINKALAINDFLNKLIDNWTITQELFAFSWSLMLNSILNAMVIESYGESRKKFFLNIMEAMLLYEDNKKISEINTKLRSYFTKKGINIIDIGQEEINEMYKDLSSIFGKESDIIEFFLNIEKATEFCYPSQPKQEKHEWDISEMFGKYQDEISKDLYKGTNQHKMVLSIIKEFSNRQQNDFFEILILITICSNLFAPRINPKDIFNESKKLGIKNIDKLVIAYVRKHLQNSVSFGESLLPDIEKFQEESASVKFEEIGAVNFSHILGTDQWFRLLLKNLNIYRGEMKFLENLLAVNRNMDGKQKGMTLAHSFSMMFPLFLRIYMRIMFKIKSKFPEKVLKNDFTEMVINFSKSLNIKDGKAFVNFLELYQDLYLSPPFLLGREKRKKREFFYMKPPFAVFFNHKVTVLYSNQDSSTALGKLAFYRHITSNMKELCLNGKGMTTLCTISYLKGNEFLCEGGIGGCWFSRFRIQSQGQKSLLICCKDGKANVIQTFESVERIVNTTSFEIEDVEAERKRKEYPLEDDVINKIREPQLKRLHKKKEEFYRLKEEMTGEKIKKYDGNVEDLYSYYFKKKMKFWESIKKIFIYRPLKLYGLIAKVPINYKLRRAKVIEYRTEKSVERILELIGSTI